MGPKLGAYILHAKKSVSPHISLLNSTGIESDFKPLGNPLPKYFRVTCKKKIQLGQRNVSQNIVIAKLVSAISIKNWLKWNICYYDYEWRELCGPKALRTV